MSDENRIADRERLRTVYAEPTGPAVAKVIDHVDDGAAGFIAASPLIVMSTASASRADASPRGGPPGFVRVLDRHHLAWGDLTGNNRLDSFQNLIEQSRVGLLVLVPGVVETLRVRGVARLVQDEAVLDRCALDGRVPRTAVLVTVEECYMHCGAALRRSQVWNPESWLGESERPSAAAILKAHMQTEESASDIAARLGEYYDNYIWYPGGR